jgi:hypothetical protein
MTFNEVRQLRGEEFQHVLEQFLADQLAQVYANSPRLDISITICWASITKGWTRKERDAIDWQESFEAITSLVITRVNRLGKRLGLRFNVKTAQEWAFCHGHGYTIFIYNECQQLQQLDKVELDFRFQLTKILYEISKQGKFWRKKGETNG